MTLALLLLLAGLIIAFIEAMVPTFGILATLSGACLVAAVYAAFQESAAAGWTFIGVIAVSLPILLAIAWRVFPKTRIGKSVILQDALPEGPPAAAAPPAGAQGTAWSDLRPTGLADFAGIRYTVVTDGSFIARGSAVIVERQFENQIVVRPDPSVPVSSTERSKRPWRT